jgi:RsiW-degrading membrane proteinase PrsW (M82 family)
MLWTFVSAGTLGLTSVALLQMALVKALNPVLFGANKAMAKDFWKEFTRTTIDDLTSSELARRTELASSWQNWAFIFAFSFIGAGVVEEVLKYLPIEYARRRGTAKDRKVQNRAYIDYVMAGALSFSVVEAIGFIYAAGDQGREKWPRMMLILLERIPGQVGHVAVALLSAVRAIRRDYYGEELSWWRVLGPAVLLHGAADSIFFTASALGGNVGWIHPTGVWTTVSMLGGYIGVVASIVWNVKKGLNDLDQRDLVEEASGNDMVEKEN